MTVKPVNWRRQHLIFVSLLVMIFIIVGLLAVRYDRVWDLTHNRRHTLSQTSIDIVKQLQQPLKITAFSRGNPQVKQLIHRLLDKYRQYATIELVFVNPDTAIDSVNQYGITRDGELLIHYQGRVSHATDLSETTLTRAIYQVLQSRQRQVLFVTGHSERSLGNDNNAYGALYERLTANGMKVGQVDLNVSRRVPDYTDVLVIADAKYPYGDHEITAIGNYLQDGGQLLWLNEADSALLPGLVKQLAVKHSDATIINRSAKKYQLNRNDYVVIEPQSDFPILRRINTMILLPGATPLDVLPTTAAKAWQISPLLTIDHESFLKQQRTISQATLPLNVGVVLVASDVQHAQKAVVIGDADFLSNQFIGFGQNAHLADNLFAYLSAVDTQFIQIIDTMPAAVTISEQTLYNLALTFIVIVPLLLLLMGLLIRRYLRRRG